MRKPTETELGIYYGHELFARLNGKETCECEQCSEIREKIYYQLWKNTS